MSELQSEGAEQQNVDLDQSSEQQTQTPETGADLATASESGHEENTEVNQEKVNAVINKKHFEKMEMQRERDQAKQENEQLRQQIAQQQQTSEPVVPEMPDPFDDDFEQKAQEREQKLVERANWKAQQDLSLRQQEQQAQQAQQEQLQSVQQKAQTYTERAKTFGINEQELQQAGSLVAQHGISNELTMAILDDPEGALITKMLAANPLEIEKLNGMNLYQAALHIESTIRPKAQQLKPRQTQTGQPPTRLDGRGADKNMGRFPLTGGAKFE